jgi:ligand-binding sensor domain-containing protein
MNHSKYISLIVIPFLFVYQLVAQPTNLKFDHIGLEQGLSQSTVYAITQDAQGFMWFGTQDGLNRYDGYLITVFKNNPADQTLLVLDIQYDFKQIF